MCVFIIGQYYSENNMSSKSGAAGEMLFFESEKRHGIQSLKTDTLTVSAFDASYAKRCARKEDRGTGK